MLIYKNGDILKATENIICHQVNEDGVMGGGLALQIATAYPKVNDLYKKFCDYCDYNVEHLLGESVLVSIDNSHFIANCFTQNKFVTDLLAIDKCFGDLLAKVNLKDFTVAIPYKYGCGIAKGDWNQIEEKFRRLSEEFGVDISVYKLEDK